ncbi:MAG: hypothetical protein FJW31_29030 [Acidobacteria bacterium]|nr:hypothetical protein [Acidobacteriota bacterium]
MRVQGMLVVCLVALAGLAAHSQEYNVGAVGASTGAAGIANLPVQRMGAHDLISLNVYGAPELSRSIRVSAEGQIRIPMLKHVIKADGLMPDQLEREIATALKRQRAGRVSCPSNPRPGTLPVPLESTGWR